MNQDKIINNISKAFDLIGGKYNLDSSEINDIKSNLKSKNVGFQTGGYKEISNKIYSEAKELFPNKVNYHFSGGEKDWPCKGTYFACGMPRENRNKRACLRHNRRGKKLCKWEPKAPKAPNAPKAPETSSSESTCTGPKDCTSDKAKQSKRMCLSRGFNPTTRKTDCKWGPKSPETSTVTNEVKLDDKGSKIIPSEKIDMSKIEETAKKVNNLNKTINKLDETSKKLESNIKTPLENMNNELENKINEDKAKLKELQAICKVDYKRIVDQLFEKTKVKGPEVLDLKQSLVNDRNELERIQKKCKSKAAQGNETKTNLKNILHYLSLIESKIKIEENKQKSAEDKRIADENKKKSRKRSSRKSRSRKSSSGKKESRRNKGERISPFKKRKGRYGIKSQKR